MIIKKFYLSVWLPVGQKDAEVKEGENRDRLVFSVDGKPIIAIRIEDIKEILHSL